MPVSMSLSTSTSKMFLDIRRNGKMKLIIARARPPSRSRRAGLAACAAVCQACLLSDGPWQRLRQEIVCP
jgi:hypothetical protein